MKATRKRAVLIGFILVVSCGAAGLTTVYALAGFYGLDSLFTRGVSRWVPIGIDDSRLTSVIRLALQPNVPAAMAGPFEWIRRDAATETAELPIIADGREVDRMYLTRLDPAAFRFEVHNDPAATHSNADWQKTLGATLVINGSYYNKRGYPDTPFLSGGKQLGPVDYAARQGALVFKEGEAEIVDLRQKTWQTAFGDAHDALVSYPLLLAGGQVPAIKPSRWLSSRSFVAKDISGKLVFGTTTGGFFSLDRLAAFLKDAPLDLVTALNLDGGPVACQSVDAGTFRRDVCGNWELQVTTAGQIRLLTWPWGHWDLPVAIAAIPTGLQK
jgi:hypothetical protein